MRTTDVVHRLCVRADYPQTILYKINLRKGLDLVNNNDHEYRSQLKHSSESYNRNDVKTITKALKSLYTW